MNLVESHGPGKAPERREHRDSDLVYAAKTILLAIVVFGSIILMASALGAAVR